MKVLVLGGYGAVGTAICGDLAQTPHISEVVCAGRNIDKAKQLAQKLKSDKVTPKKVDASSSDELMKAIKEVDIVINTSLPEYNLIVMEAALKNRAHYIDNAVYNKVDSKLKFDNAYKDAGITGLLNLGEDPGLANIFARYAADRMDCVDEIRIRDGETCESDNYPFMATFSPEVFLGGEIFLKPLVFEDGKFKHLPPFSGEEVYNFPDPIGPVTLYYTDHEETETLPVFIKKGVKYVDFKLAFAPETVGLLKTLKELGLMDMKPINVKGVKVSPLDVFISLIPTPAEIGGKVEGYACILADVRGEKAGDKIHHIVYTFMNHKEAYRRLEVTATAYLTGLPAAVGAAMLADGTIKKRGVYPPEVLEPEPFLDRIRQKDIPILEKVTVERSLA
ncbi:MAG: saccharopine dehydrogenase NADP-binding domain-containing protein [Candidatus Bathyarchaeota archaeon]|nr:MAG: saccharopine dehydrogenase NADP-binding domain-containing protein [Candidatus Bathyarchaeota archaeon]